MKEKIIYIVSFLLAFALVTGLLIFLNSTYNNIFTFDFTTTVQTAAEIKKLDQIDSTKIHSKDSTIVNVTPEATIAQKIDSLQSKTTSVNLKDSNTVQIVSKKLAEEIKPALKILQTASSDPIKVDRVDKNLAKRDSLHKAWVKNTAKLYESMDTRKAAKIIQGYSDNIVRDLLLTMKKKKAAEILAEFKPETATRIISAVQ